MYVTAIVLAAGKGRRFSRLNSFTVRGGIPRRNVGGKSKIPKLLAEINSQPIIIYSLGIFNKHPCVRDIIIVVNAKNSRSIINKISQYKIGKIIRVVKGGRRRQDSVRKGLEAMDNRTDLVLIHDGARPFIDKGLVSALIRNAKKWGAAIAGVPAKATIKKVKSKKAKGKSLFVEKTIDRNNLWEIQTPQVFKKDLILKAYNKRFSDIEATDDAMLVEKLGAKISVIPGSYNNIKITTPEDLILAEAIVKTWNTK